MIVVDASVAVEMVLRSAASRTARKYLLARRETMHAPHLLDLEVANVLRRCLLRGEIDESGGAGALANLQRVPIARHPHQPLLERVWRLRHNLTAYDAAYLALAETLDAPLLTRDAGLAAVSGHRARVELVQEPAP